MLKHLNVLFLSLCLFLFAIACSESGGVGGNKLSNAPAGGSADTGNIGADNGNASNNEGNAPDDQTPEAKVNTDFSSPINLVGRYKISAIKIVNPQGVTTIEKTAKSGEFRGAFAVGPKVAETISIDMGIKFQFRPDVAKQLAIQENLAYFNNKINKIIDTSAGLDFVKIFADLGAKIEGKTVYFTLTEPDMPIETGASITLTLEKVSNVADFKISNDPRKYWLADGEQEEVIEPEEPEQPEPEVPSDGTVTSIDMNVPSTLTGHYKITRFITVAASATVDSGNLPRMEGEIALKGSAAAVEAISKMQMEATVTGMTENDKYNYTAYNPFIFNGSNLTSTTPDPYKYSSATITKKGDRQIEINQSLKKNAPVVGLTDVQVTVIATKISDTPKSIIDCGYWTAGTVVACNADGSAAVTNIDPANKDTYVGSYSLNNYGMEYQRPAGGQYEQIWAEVAILDGIIYQGELLIKRIKGALSVKKGSDGNLAIDFKTQVDVPYQTQKEYITGDFNDLRWRFFREIDTKDFSVNQTANKNELAIRVKRTLSYRYWGKQYNIDTYISFLVQKQSDIPTEVTKDQYWPTDDGQAIVVPTMSDPRTFTGHYKLTNIGHNFYRPGGGAYDSWATNPTAMTNLQGELSFKYNGTDLKTSDIHAKYQVDSTLYAYVWGTGFSDSKWKFFNEAFNNATEVTLEGNNIKVCTNRNFSYKIVGKEKNPSVRVCFIGEKIADEPKAINGNKYR